MRVYYDDVMNNLSLRNETEGGDYNFLLNDTSATQSRRDSLYVVIPVTVIYTLIFVTGVLGNIVTCIVIAKNKYMHTATNYYLFSLAISDLLLLVTGLPQEMVSIWYNYPYLFGEAFCVLRGLAAEASANATVLTITAFTAERYIAICYPFLSHTMSKLTRAVKLIIVIWVVSLIFAVPHAAQIGVVGSAEYATCNLKRIIFDHSFEISTLLFFVIPMTIITVLYALIGLKLKRSSVIKRESGCFYPNTEENQRDSRSRRHQLPTQSSRRVVNMLAAVVVAFFICWAPFHTQRLIAIYGTNEQNFPKEPIMVHIYTIVTYISGIFYYLSATINPILYHIMSLKFREAFKETVARCCGLGGLKRPRRERRYSVLSRGRAHARSSHGQSQSTDNSGHSVQEESYTSHPLSRHTTLYSRASKRTKTTSLSDGTDESYPSLDGSPWHNEGKKGPNVPRKGSHCEQQFSVILRLRPSSPKRRRFPLRNVFRHNPKIRRSRARYYIETAATCDMTLHGQPAMMRCNLGAPANNISNSSLKDYDKTAMSEELIFYMREYCHEEEDIDILQGVTS